MKIDMRKISNRIIIISCFVIALLAVGSSVFFYAKYQSLAKKSASNVKDDAALTVAAVSKLMLLPSDETPTVATVSDAEKLKSQSFFAASQNGDKVLIFTQAKKAVLYRPSTNMIIDVAPVNLGNDASTSATQKESAPTFVLYNGTNVTGRTKAYESTLKGLIANAVVVSRDNAGTRDYDKSIIIDLTGTKSAQVSAFAKTLGLDVSTLPGGETKPDGADFLIILGADKK